MSQFVNTKTVTEVVNKINVNGPDFIYMSVVPVSGGINLVIGAKYENRLASALTKEGLALLIGDLAIIHDALPDLE